MNPKLTTSLYFLLACSVLLQAAPARDIAAASSPLPLPEEITIEGRKSVTALQHQIHAAEDVLFGLFNELNDDELYDIHCAWKAPLGTRILQRSCRPNFYLDILEKHAEGNLALIRGEAGGTMHADNVRLAARYDTLKTRMAELLEQDSELREALSQVNALYQELESRQNSRGSLSE